MNKIFDLFITPILSTKSTLDNKLMSDYIMNFCKDSEVD